MKKNLLILVGFVVFLVGFTGCEIGLVPGKDYVIDGLDKFTKGNRIPEDLAKTAIGEFRIHSENLPDSCEVFLPDYEVFAIHELLEFISMSDPETKPAYIVVRQGIFNVPNDPNDPSGASTRMTKSILYMTDANHNPVRNPGTESQVLFFEELRRCPPDTNCRPIEDVQPID